MGTYKAAIVGLGSMGMGMARSAHAAGLQVVGCDLNETARRDLEAAGAATAETAVDAAAVADAVAVVVVNAQQTEAVLFGPGGAAEGLAPGAVVLGCATVPATFAVETADRLAERGILYLDAPISGGPVKSAEGALTVMASGSEDAFAKAQPLLDAVAETVFNLDAEAGPASTMKTVNQLLAGVHIATAMEAVALGIKAGLEAETVFEVITKAAGNSWMFENRVPHVIDGDYSPKSAVGIFTKDLGIVLGEAEHLGIDLPLSEAALARFRAAAEMGLEGADDAAVIKVYAEQAGIQLPGDGD